MTEEHNVLFTNKGFYLTLKTKPDANSKFIGGHGSDNLYTQSNEGRDGV